MPTERNNGTPEQNQEVLRRVIEEGFNKGNYAALDPSTQPVTGNTSSG